MHKIDPVILYQLYVDEKLSIRSIAERLQVAPRTVSDALIRERIPRRSPGLARFITFAHCGHTQQPLYEAKIRHLYLVEQRSIREIADIVGRGTTTVFKALRAWNIPRRKPGRHEKPTSL